MAEKEFNIPIRKTPYPNNRPIYRKTQNEQSLYLRIARGKQTGLLSLLLVNTEETN